MASYQPAAGPSRFQHPAYPPPLVPSKSPIHSPSFDHAHSPWSDTPMQMPKPEPNVHDARDRDEREPDSRRNPLVDLIDSEKGYVEQLSLVIRKVAAAWSRKDFPPPKLDAMFRCVEAVYRANRAFGNKLKDIGPNPSSPKALGDLLMRWIDDLEPSYHKYTTTFLTGFDSYPLITVNTILPGILRDITLQTPPPAPLMEWSLDALFLLPYTRLRYYRKLYARLLRSTKEGRSDHRLLVVANNRLENLVSEVEGRLELDVAEDEGETSQRQSRASSAMDSSLESHSNFSPFSSRIEDARNSNGSTATSITQSPQRRPTIQVATTNSNYPSANAQSPIYEAPSYPLSDLELRVDPERAIDLFTMQPKKCKLQMNPPTLPFTRTLRSSHDVTVFFTPTSTGAQVVHRRAHVFILSDLFLVTDRMEAVEKAMKAQQVAREQPERVGEGGPMPEMWLAYPPLAGKHLMVAEGTQANVLTVMIMRKETFIIHAESDMARDQIMKDLIDCVDYAASGAPARKPTLPLSGSGYDARSPSSTISGEHQFPPLRYPSPFSGTSSPSQSPRPPDTVETPPALFTQMSKMSLEPGQIAGDELRWPQGPSPPAQQQQQPQMAVLPPRGASLRTRVQSNNTMMSSEPALPGAPIPRSSSGRSVASSQSRGAGGSNHSPNLQPPVPPVPFAQMRHNPSVVSHLSDSSSYDYPNPNPGHLGSTRSRSAEPLRPPNAQFAMPPPNLGPPAPPSARFSSFPLHEPEPRDDSPPTSPVEEETATLSGPATISAQMKCKVFLKQSHQQWKSLGSAKLKLYVEQGRNVKQLVVESDSSSKSLLISTIVLTDGVERVAKTGVAVEISDRGHRTGIVYMIQLRNENSAAGLFESLLAGSDRSMGGR